jgi:hypothetical protein
MSDERIILGGANPGSGDTNNDQSQNFGENKNAKSSQDIAAEYNIPAQYLDNEFQVPTETIELPSRGAFYPNKKSSVTIKYLTAEEDDILYSPDLIRSGRVLDVLLDKAVIDRDLRPDTMISGDRNFLLVEIRKTGLGNEYVPGEIQCSSCSQVYEPTIDLDKLKAKPLEVMPDENGEYEIKLPMFKKTLKFRLLTGQDEKRISKIAEASGKKNAGGIKISKLVTEKYVMQIMEVDGNRDKLYIKKFISAMPMKDSLYFREYLKRVEPGLDLSYEFECPHCGELEIKDIPITPKLFYPDLEK